MGRYLIVTWDGAGNLVPTLGIARTLVERGHDVRMMGHSTIVERCGDVGTRFVPLSQGELWDAMDDPDDFEAEVRLLIERALLQLDHRPGRRAGAGTGAGRRGAGRLHAVHGDRRRAGIGHSDRDAVPHAVHDLPGRTAGRDVRAGRADRERAARQARPARHRETRRHPRRLRMRDRRAAEGVRARRAGCGQRAAHRSRARRASAVPRDRRASTSATGRRRWSSSVSAPASRARPTCCSGASMRSRSCRCAPS